MIPVLGAGSAAAGGGDMSSTSTCCTWWFASRRPASPPTIWGGGRLRGRELGGVGVGGSLQVPLEGVMEVSGTSLGKKREQRCETARQFLCRMLSKKAA